MPRHCRKCELPCKICACAEAEAYDKANPFESDKQRTAKQVIELNKNCTCDNYYYHNIVLYCNVIWRVNGSDVVMFKIGD